MKKLNKKRIIYLFLITTIIVTITSMAKYKTTITSSDFVKIAFPIVKLKTNEDNYLTFINAYNNNPQELTFIITNTSDENISSEVTMKYHIEIDTLNNLPIIYTLYKYNKETQEYELEQLENKISNEKIIHQSTSIEDKYKIKIEWDNSSEEYKNYKYSKEIEYIKIKVPCEQVD